MSLKFYKSSFAKSNLTLLLQNLFLIGSSLEFSVKAKFHNFAITILSKLQLIL